MRNHGLRRKGIRQPRAWLAVTLKRTQILLAAAALTGCLGSEAPPGGGGLAAGINGDNTPPKISGSPQPVAVMSDAYLFRPSASDADGDTLTFSIRNKPAWASFDAATGQLEGIPQFGDVGTYEGIEISVSDGAAIAALPRFSIAVSSDALGSVTLEWMPPQSNTDGSVASDLAGYVIYWGTEPGNYDQQVRIDNVGLTAYVVDSLRPGTYYFTATAFNSAGVHSDFSNEVERLVVVN
jgi:hypothetical protein